MMGLQYFGGGRYDGLIEEVGGAKTPAVGFATGMDRLIDVFDTYSNIKINDIIPDLYLATIGDEAMVFANKLSLELRRDGIFVEKDICGRALKAQFKYADKIGAKFVITIGEEEIKNNKAKLKYMKTGEEKDIFLNKDDIEKELRKFEK